MVGAYRIDTNVLWRTRPHLLHPLNARWPREKAEWKSSWSVVLSAQGSAVCAGNLSPYPIREKTLIFPNQDLVRRLMLTLRVKSPGRTRSICERPNLGH